MRDIRFRSEWAVSPRLRSIYQAEPDRAVLEEFRWKIAAGPFEGMAYIGRSSGSTLAAKILGCYERELHRIMAGTIRHGYDQVVDIGCAEGYYAVGLAWKSGVGVTAYDTDPEARQRLVDLAELNGVSDLIKVSELCQHSSFSAFAGQRVLVICDIEGGEAELLDPTKAPALRQFDILVEIHDGEESSAIHDLLVSRFAASHKIEVIPFEGRTEADASMITWIRKPQFLRAVVDERRRLGLEWMYLKAGNEDD